MVDHEAFVPELAFDSTVAVTAHVFRMYGLDPLAFISVTVVFLLDVVVVCGAGQPACLQEMFERVFVAQSSDCLGPIPNISAFSSWSRAFNFFR